VGQGHEPAFARRIGQRIRLGHVRPCGRNQHHGTLRVAQRALGCTGQQESSREIHREDAVPAVERELGKWAAQVYAGVRDDRIDPAELVDTLVHQPLNVGFDADIANDSIAVGRLCHVGERGPIDVGQHHLPPLSGQADSRRCPDAAGSAGYDHDFSLTCHRLAPDGTKAEGERSARPGGPIRSPVESWQPLQLELNDITNLRLDTLKRSIAPLAKVKKGRGVDLTAVQRRGQPDSILLLDNPEDVILEPTPGPSGQAYTETSITNANFDELAGVFSTSSVQQSRQLNETVGGMRLMSGAANTVSEFDLRVWVEPVLRQLVHLVKHYENDERIVLIAGRKARTLEEFGFQPRATDFDHADVTLRVNVGAGAADPMQRLAKLRTAFEMLAPLMPIMEKQGISPKVEELIDEVMGAAGFKDGRRFFEFGEPPEQQQDPDVQKVMLEMQLEREKMANDFRQLMIELMSEERRNTEDNQTKLQIAGVQGRNQLAAKVVDIAADREARAHGDMVRREDMANQQQIRSEDRQDRRRQDAIKLFAERMRGGVEKKPEEPAQLQPQEQQPRLSDLSLVMMSRIAEQLSAMQMGQANLMRAMTDLQARMTALVRFIRDPSTGKPVGIEKAGQVQQIVRDNEGLIAGTAPAQQPSAPAIQ